MKECPECKRIYYDETLYFCLEDGSSLVNRTRLPESRASVTPSDRFAKSSTLREPAEEKTAILPSNLSDATRRTGPNLHRRIRLLIYLVAFLSLTGVFAYQYFKPNNQQTETTNPDRPSYATKLFWQMNEAEQLEFVSDRAAYIQKQLGDVPYDHDEEATRSIKVEIDYYVKRKDSLSQKEFEEGLRTIYGRASQYAPIVIRAYEGQRVPPVLGVYQAMIESEYRDCPLHPHPKGPVGLFQFSRKTAAKYALTSEDYCNVEKQSEAAARHMSDLISDFGQEKSSWTLALFSFNDGADTVRNYMRQLRTQGITERSFWVLLKHRQLLQPPVNLLERNYVARFFAAAIIGETPEAFELATPPLTTIRVSAE